MQEEKDVTYRINPKRLRYILDLYKLPDEEFLNRVNEDRKKNLLTNEDLKQIFNNTKEVNLSLLKRIDNIFDMGVTWYISDRVLPEKKNGSIFFRKDSFNSQLNLESMKKVNQFEELKFEIFTLCNYISFKPEKIIRKDLTENEINAAKEMKQKFSDVENSLLKEKIIHRTSDPKEYLKNLIRIIEEFNIFVFEFIDRKTDDDKKIKFDGFFISPNIIVIKRQQDYPRREIFTLIHEFAHCLLDKEEIDIVLDGEQIINSNLIEKWCYNFSYYFLSGEYNEIMDKFEIASPTNNFLAEEVEKIYNNTFLSYSSIYYHLLQKRKIAYNDYLTIKNSINLKVEDNIKRKKEQQKQERDLKTEPGEKQFFGVSRPIVSNLFKEIVEINFIQGNINRNDLKNYKKIFSSNIMYEVI